MKPLVPPTNPQTDDSRSWVGGEASVGSQAGQHVRRQAGVWIGYQLGTILGLTFLGGLALGGAVALVLSKD